MEFIIDYELSEFDKANYSEVDLIEADEMDLRYDFFLGSIILKSENFDHSVMWGWVPVLDFSICIFLVLKELNEGSNVSSVDFTESDAKINFTKREDDIIITSTFSDVEGIVGIDHFNKSVKLFCDKVRSNFLNEYPVLKSNDFVKETFGTWVKYFKTMGFKDSES